MIKIHEIQGYIQTIYLVEYPDKLVLLDSGCRCDVEKVKKYIETIGRSLSDLKLVVVTHAHPDHSGGHRIYQKKYHIPIAAPMNINDWYSGLPGILTYVVDIFLTYLVATKKKRGIKWIGFPRRVRADYFLQNLDLLPGFEDWQVLNTPGHTESDISLYHKEKSKIYIADNIVKSKNSLYRPYPINSPEKFQRSLEKYIELAPQHYLLAHHGECEIKIEKLIQLKSNVPKVPRNHRNTLPHIIKHLFINKVLLQIFFQ